MNPTIAISMGDYNGIGPEVICKTLSKTNLSESIPIIIGHHSVMEYYADKCGLNLPFQTIKKAEGLSNGSVYILNSSKEEDIVIHPGKISAKAGKAAMKAVEKAVVLQQKKKCSALVTAPISKEAIQKAGYTFPGHTEFLAELTNTGDYMMILASGDFRVGLATIHVPLKKVQGLITENGIIRFLKIFNKSLKTDFGIIHPKIAVLGLNPHAGDGGVIGTEEQMILTPALQKARFNDIDVKGPFAADAFFGNQTHKHYDGILAMYHDQGLIPFKTLTFGTGVNFTAGLPIIRTSPDHGTAFDIAGLNKAKEDSFTAAYKLAKNMAGIRNTRSN
ncbi:MAG: 4-hydroxythreonine-4-phosphate dehydrogenase PdxA [Balneolaceae bacterium]